jgi:hypothetical protein
MKSKLTFNQVQIIITVGIGYDRNHAPIPDHVARKQCQAIANRVSRVCGGVTLREVIGSYQHDNGTVVVEPSIEFVAMAANDERTIATMRGICQFAKDQLKQESVLFACIPANWELVND